MSRIVVACVHASSIAVVPACGGEGDVSHRQMQTRLLDSFERFFRASPLLD
jgi:hypothetical protein